MILRYMINHKTHMINIHYGDYKGNFTEFTVVPYSRSAHEFLVEQTPNFERRFVSGCWIVENPIIYRSVINEST